MRMKLLASRFGGRAQFTEVVELAVITDHMATIVADHRLVASRAHIQHAQAAMSQHTAAIAR